MASRRRRLGLWALCALALAGLSAGAWARWGPGSSEPSPVTWPGHGCGSMLNTGIVHGRQVTFQGSGRPGHPAFCDRSDNKGVPSPGEGAPLIPVIGYDCKIRNAKGKVIDTAEPQRADRTCGPVVTDPPPPAVP